MKKFFAVLFSTILCVSVPLSLTSCNSGITLHVYNWGEYIDDKDFDVNAQFTKETGIKIKYDTYENNEDMHSKLKAGAAQYDIVFPSDYMAGQMIEEGMLAKLDFSNIPNYSLIDDAYKNLPYDPNNEYTVPYMWGVVGIFYNSKYVDAADLSQGWDLLWDAKYKGKICMFDNQRDAFAVALQKLGYSINSTDPTQWQAAYDELVKQKPLLYAYRNDQVYEDMINENAWIAPYYAGDAMIMCNTEDDAGGNGNVKVFIPSSGTNFFVDTVCVTSTCKYQKEAEEYINFLCRTDVALANAEYIGYSTPQKEARQELPATQWDDVFYPSADVMAKTEMMLTQSDSINTLMNDLWVKLKT